MTKAEVINYWIAAGSGVIPIGEDKKPAMKWGGPMITPNLDSEFHQPDPILSADIEQFRWTRPERANALKAYAVVPQEAGFVVLDLDNHPGKNPLTDIRFVWRELFESDFPFDVATFEPRTLTPSGGYHLWFRCRPDEACMTGASPKDSEGREFEIKGYSKYVLGPGSVTAKGEYRLVGDLRDAPDMPSELGDVFAYCDPPPPKHRSVFNDGADVDRMLGWWFIERGVPRHGNLNNTAFQFASWCYRQGVSLEDCISRIEPHTASGPYDRGIRRTIEGVYKRGC